MGEQGKGSKGSVSSRKATTKIKWIRLNSNSNLVFSTSDSRKERVIYYTQKGFTSDDR